MNIYTTIIRAISPTTGNLLAYSGPKIPGTSFENAQEYCENNGLGYCEVDGILLEVIPVETTEVISEWDINLN